MHIVDVYRGAGAEGFAQLVRGISIGKLKTYQIYEGFKVRAHLQKVNTETLRKAVPRLWERIGGRDEEFAKDLEAQKYFTEGWESRVMEHFHSTYSEALLLFYVNHLRWELLNATGVYL